MSPGGNDFRRFCPGSGNYIAPVLRVGNSIGEQYPKKCDQSWKPPVECFIHRPEHRAPERITLPVDNSSKVMPAGLVLGKDYYRLSRNASPTRPYFPPLHQAKSAAGLHVTSVLPFNII